MTDNAKRFLTVPEVAAEVRQSPRTIIHWLATGRLPGKRIGKYWLVERTELERVLTQASNPAAKAG